MEQFIETVHSITARSSLSHALQIKRPFRSFKDSLQEYQILREQWFHFEAEKLRQETISFIENFDWEVVEVVDSRPQRRPVVEQVDPAERVPLTDEEYEWILRGASGVVGKGGRSQLSLLLKGSKKKTLLKYGLDQSAAYGKLSFLTIEEIENRIDHIIRKGDLKLEYFGGDLPLIVLADSSWEHVRPWALQQKAVQASVADQRKLKEIVLTWRTSPRQEQMHLVEAVCSLDAEAAYRVLQAWHTVAGKEVRKQIEAKIAQRPAKTAPPALTQEP